MTEYVLLGYGDLHGDPTVTRPDMEVVRMPEGLTIHLYSSGGRPMTYGRYVDLWQGAHLMQSLTDKEGAVVNQVLHGGEGLDTAENMDALQQAFERQGMWLILPGVDGWPDPLVLCDGDTDTCPAPSNEIAQGEGHTCTGVLGSGRIDPGAHLHWRPYPRFAIHCSVEEPWSGEPDLAPGRSAGFDADTASRESAPGPDVQQALQAIEKQNRKVMRTAKEGARLQYLTYASVLVVASDSRFAGYSRERVARMRQREDCSEGEFYVSHKGKVIRVHSGSDWDRVSAGLRKITTYALLREEVPPQGRRGADENAARRVNGRLLGRDTDVLKKKRKESPPGEKERTRRERALPDPLEAEMHYALGGGILLLSDTVEFSEHEAGNREYVRAKECVTGVLLVSNSKYSRASEKGPFISVPSGNDLSSAQRCLMREKIGEVCNFEVIFGEVDRHGSGKTPFRTAPRVTEAQRRSIQRAPQHTEVDGEPFVSECRRSTATVEQDSHIQVGGARYSVSWRLIGKQVDVEEGTNVVRVYYRGRLVQKHQALTTGTQTDRFDLGL
ncbi:hypothetical protein [Streptomyces sp. WAC06614]|uniref:Mu transposase domain-containing protein n=1 Tax=Streptomyces sp. WAC06614 TaxID=2487416 RepID=UPI000F7A4807|nr:hypothetical protein [Streptomyces sp. WAC06614]RSS81246.1 hypothetical protein EF918_11045 [Streptomyces sp. WAC06614]